MRPQPGRLSLVRLAFRSQSARGALLVVPSAEAQTYTIVYFLDYGRNKTGGKIVLLPWRTRSRFNKVRWLRVKKVAAS